MILAPPDVFPIALSTENMAPNSRRYALRNRLIGSGAEARPFHVGVLPEPEQDLVQEVSVQVGAEQFFVECFYLGGEQAREGARRSVPGDDVRKTIHLPSQVAQLPLYCAKHFGAEGRLEGLQGRWSRRLWGACWSCRIEIAVRRQAEDHFVGSQMAGFDG